MTRTLPLLIGLLLACAACSTKRAITIESEPTGARVWLDGKERGTTPLTVPFVYYGDAELRLEKEGYQSLATVLVVPTQIDGYPYIDLPFELTVRQRQFRYKATLQPLRPDPTDAEVRGLLDRAAAFRERTRREADAQAVNAPLRGERAPCPEARPIEGPPPLVRPVGGGR